MAKKLLVFDTHPVQYRVPIWQNMEAIRPNCIHVVYGSDCSVRGHIDTEFNCTIVWDEPMLAGYNYTILNCEKGVPLSGWGSLTGKGIKHIFDSIQFDAVLLTGLNYKYDLIAYFEAIRRGIPIWLRCETQDQSTERSKFKSVCRSLIYRCIYSFFDKIFYIGELNKRHYLKHGVSISKLRPARYGTIDRFDTISESKKKEIRKLARQKALISNDNFVVGFSGKLISKKNPEILFQMLKSLPDHLRSRTFLYFLGSGELEKTLKDEADKALSSFGVNSFFAGFVNQSAIASHYLAMDVLVLPSRKMGETWGLVVNEAMQAGCSVIVSDAVGCSADFKSWENFRVFKVGESTELATCLSELAHTDRDFDWAEQNLKAYSINANAEIFSEELNLI